jgi:hypothetical protein
MSVKIDQLGYIRFTSSTATFSQDAFGQNTFLRATVVGGFVPAFVAVGQVVTPVGTGVRLA